jgi:hypothetical protein
MKKDDKHYAQLSAAFNPEMVWVEPPKSDEALPKDSIHQSVAAHDEMKDEPVVTIKQQAETLNAKFKGWVYELAAYKVDDLEKKRNDLIELPAAQEPIGDIDLEGLQDLPLSMPPFDISPPSLFQEEEADEPLSSPFSFSNVQVEKPEALPTPLGTPTTTNETMIPVP